MNGGAEVRVGGGTEVGTTTPALLEVRDLRKHFPVRGGIFNRAVAWVKAVDDVDLEVRPGEVLGIVGESGCGKSTTARLLMHLIRADAGRVTFDGALVNADDAAGLREVRRQMQMVFQDSYSSLNPRLPIEETIMFGPKVHGVSAAAARERARELFALVGLDPAQFIRRYPHELSGGQRQRVNIARALALEPRLLILDEAVSALDKSVEAQVLNLLLALRRELGLTYIFISHDLNVVQYMSDGCSSCTSGRWWRSARRPTSTSGCSIPTPKRSSPPCPRWIPTGEPRFPRSPETRRTPSIRHPAAGFIRAAVSPTRSAGARSLASPRCAARTAAATGTPVISPPATCGWRIRVTAGLRRDLPMSAAPSPAAAARNPIVRAEDVSVRFESRDATVQAVNSVSFTLDPGEVLCILGESGSGKSVTLRALMRLLPPRRSVLSGHIEIGGRDVLAMSERDLADLRGTEVGMIFQEPMVAFDPVYTVGRQIIETIVRHEGVNRQEARRRALDLLERVRIPSPARRLRAYPHELSGGMRQRAMIALALSCRPSLLLADEPTTALDATVQIQILLLLRELQRELGMAVIFVTHDVGVAVEIADRIAVMYGGRFVETGPVRQIMRDPHHPYTQGLLTSTVHGSLRGTLLEAIPGSPPDMTRLPPGCAFAPRCRFAEPRCESPPPTVGLSPRHMVRCVRAA